MAKTTTIFKIFMISDENESLRWKNKKLIKIQLPFFKIQLPFFLEAIASLVVSYVVTHSLCQSQYFKINDKTRCSN